MLENHKQLEIEDLLRKEEQYLDFTELHALLSGYICGGGNNRPEVWTEVICGQAMVAPLLQELYDDVEQELSSINFEFMLPLPGDDAPLAANGKALVKWIQEFLTGFGLSGCDSPALQLHDVKEALADLSNITQLNTDEIAEADEEQAGHLIELVEYCRSVIMYIYTEVHGGTATSGQA